MSDTLKAAAGAEGGGKLFTELFEHAYDSRELELPFIGHVHLPHFEPLHLGGITIDLSITKHVVFLWVAALVVILLAVVAARKISNRWCREELGISWKCLSCSSAMRSQFPT